MRGLGGDRAGEMRISRFLHNPKVTVAEMLATARARACAQVAGRRVLAIQDTSALRVDEKGVGLSFHPVIAVDAGEGTALGLVEAFFLTRRGGESGKRKPKRFEEFEEKDSRRRLDRPALERVRRSLEGKTARQNNPHPPDSLAHAAWVFERLGGWTGYYGKTGPIVMLRGLTQFHAIKHGWSLRDV